MRYRSDRPQEDFGIMCSTISSPSWGAVGLSLSQIQHFPCGHVYRLPSILSTSRNSPLVSVQMPISTSPQVIMGESPLSWRTWGLQSGRNLL